MNVNNLSLFSELKTNFFWVVSLLLFCLKRKSPPLSNSVDLENLKEEGFSRFKIFKLLKLD